MSFAFLDGLHQSEVVLYLMILLGSLMTFEGVRQVINGEAGAARSRNRRMRMIARGLDEERIVEALLRNQPRGDKRARGPVGGLRRSLARANLPFGPGAVLAISAALACGIFFIASTWTPAPAAMSLALGLGLIAFGSGGIKPCVSAHVGDQFGKSNGNLLEKVFGWFYFSINLGAFASTLLTPWLLEHYGPHIAFGVPGALMVLATIFFWMGRKVFIHIPPGGMDFVREAFSKEGLSAIGRLAIIYASYIYYCICGF